MSAAPAGDRIHVLADLHMSPGPHEHFEEGAALTSLIEDLHGGALEPERTRVVLLGDTFELSGIERGEARSAEVSTRHALRRLEEIHRRHAAPLTALGRLAADGVTIDVLPGNHDFQLARAAVQRRFVELLSAGADGRPGDLRVRFHPWVLHLPGTLYAEHGQQHHPINRVAWLSAAADGGDPGPTPLGTQLGECLVALAGSPAPRPLGRLLAGAAPALLATSRSARAPAAESSLSAAAAQIGLPVAALEEIERMSAAGAARTLATTLRAALGHAHEPYMLRAARDIERVLARHDSAVPFYLFGHTHVAADSALGSGGARYLNPGTWSTFRPPGAPPRDRGLTLVEIDAATGERPTARLMRWDPDQRRRVPAGAGSLAAGELGVQ